MSHGAARAEAGHRSASPRTNKPSRVQQLLRAAADGDVAAARPLLKQHPELVRRYGGVALVTACWKGHTELVREVVQHEQCRVHMVVQPCRSPRVDPEVRGMSALQVACMMGSVDTVRALLDVEGAEAGVWPATDGEADADSDGEDAECALWLACFNGHDAVVELLLTRCSGDTRLRKYGPRALELATAEGHAPVVRALVAPGRLPPAVVLVGDGTTAAAVAVDPDVDSVPILRVLAQRDPASVATCSVGGLRPFELACRSGDVAAVEFLLSLPGLVPRYTTPGVAASGSGATTGVAAAAAPLDDEVLFFAAANGHAGVVKLLLADDRFDELVRESPYREATAGGALPGAAVQGHADVVRLLVADARVDVNARQGRSDTGDTVLMMVCKRPTGPNLEVLQALLEAPGIDATLQSRRGNTAWRHLAGSGNARALQVMVDQTGGAGVNVPSLAGSTPLCCALDLRHAAAVRTLLSCPGIEIPAQATYSAYSEACRGGDLEMVETLGHHPHTDPFDHWVRGDDMGRSFFWKACYNGNLEVVKALARNPRVDQLQCDDGGVMGEYHYQCGKWTPFHVACSLGHLPVVRFLLFGGEPAESIEELLNRTDPSGECPLQTAADNYHASVVAFLAELPEMGPSLHGVLVNMQRRKSWPVHTCGQITAALDRYHAWQRRRGLLLLRLAHHAGRVRLRVAVPPPRRPPAGRHPRELIYARSPD